MTDRLEQLEKLHAADPTDADVTYMIAMEHSKADNHRVAVDWLDKTIHADADYLYAYYQKAKSQYAQDQTEAARATAQAGIDKALAASDAKAEGELSELLISLH